MENQSKPLTEQISDNQLVLNIQSGINVKESLEELEVRHSGIYISQMKKFKNSFGEKHLGDFLDDKKYFIWKCASRFDVTRGDAKFSTYLAVSATREVNSIYHKNKHSTEWPEFEGEPVDFPAKEEVQNGLFQEVVNVLNERSKDIAIRYFYYGQTYNEIGQVYGVTRQRIEQIVKNDILVKAREII